MIGPSSFPPAPDESPTVASSRQHISGTTPTELSKTHDSISSADKDAVRRVLNHEYGSQPDSSSDNRYGSDTQREYEEGRGSDTQREYEEALRSEVTYASSNEDQTVPSLHPEMVVSSQRSLKGVAGTAGSRDTTSPSATSASEYENSRLQISRNTSHAPTSTVLSKIEALLRLGRHAVGRKSDASRRDLVKRRVTRKNGIADCLADTVSDLIELINQTNNLKRFPLTHRMLIERFPEGHLLFEKEKIGHTTQLLAQSAVDLARTSGPACKQAVIEVLSRNEIDGKKLPVGVLAEAAGC